MSISESEFRLWNWDLISTVLEVKVTSNVQKEQAPPIDSENEKP